MKGFKKILKFKTFQKYEDARKIADDIIVSLVKNSGFETNDEKDFLPTYISTVRETFCSKFANFFDFSVSEDELEAEFELFNDKKIGDYCIVIYEVDGNRKSKLSVTQNKKLRDMIFC